MADKLGVWNKALRLCKERMLTSLTESREAARLLIAAWGDGSTTGSVKRCLQLGQWTFAMRTAEVEYSPSVEPSFGYRYAFDQPDDLVKVSAVCSDPYFKAPLLEYADERQHWFADLQTIYVRFVSNLPEYGADLSIWSEAFADLVAIDLAFEIVGSLTEGDKAFGNIFKLREKAVADAKSLDAMNRPTAFMPEGTWTQSRRRSNRNSGHGGWTA